MTALRHLIDQLADIRRDGFEIGMVVSDASIVLGHLYKVRLRSVWLRNYKLRARFIAL